MWEIICASFATSCVVSWLLLREWRFRHRVHHRTQTKFVTIPPRKFAIVTAGLRQCVAYSHRGKGIELPIVMGRLTGIEVTAEDGTEPNIIIREASDNIMPTAFGIENKSNSIVHLVVKMHSIEGDDRRRLA